MITIKRAYEPAAADDGFRVYIDRLWPRGLSHETFHYDLWDKEIAPTTELREWFHEDPDNRWTEFEKRYRNELLGNPSLKSLLDAIAGKPTVTLLYSSRDHEHNNAVVVKNVISEATPVQQPGDQH
ncbi:MAG: DUF488 family protein [Bacteroides sp.]|nr:DUF488 family protein [Bacteroides sp.]